MTAALRVFAAEGAQAAPAHLRQPARRVLDAGLAGAHARRDVLHDAAGASRRPAPPQRWPLVAEPHRLAAFLAAGALAYTFFFSLVQSAWHFSFERISGTLEALFLTPANRMALVVANGSGALVQNAWLFGVFAIAAAVATGTLHVAHPGMYPVAVVALLVPAVAWGAFLNSLLMFSRDSAFLYTLLDDPLWFVAGVRLPLFALALVDKGDRAGLPADHEPRRAARRAAGRAQACASWPASLRSSSGSRPRCSP